MVSYSAFARPATMLIGTVAPQSRPKFGVHTRMSTESGRLRQNARLPIADRAEARARAQHGKQINAQSDQIRNEAETKTWSTTSEDRTLVT